MSHAQRLALQRPAQFPARRKHPLQRRGGLRSLIAAALSMPLLPVLAGPPAATQLPVGGQVVAGSASISQSHARMTISQSSNRAAIDWQSFNLGSQAQVTFVQPSSGSVTLNRVLDSNPS